MLGNVRGFVKYSRAGEWVCRKAIHIVILVCFFMVAE